MSKRHKDGKYAPKHSVRTILLTWLAAFVSIGLIYLVLRLFASDLAAFRSCGHNDSLKLNTCGKQGLNVADGLIFLLLVACVTLSIGLFSRAWNITRRQS